VSVHGSDLAIGGQGDQDRFVNVPRQRRATASQILIVIAPEPAMVSDGPGPESGRQGPPLPDTYSPEPLSPNILSNRQLETDCSGIRRGSGPQAGQVAGDDRLHDLGRATINPHFVKPSTMELMKSQVEGHFVLASGVDCSPLAAGVSNISSNTALPGPGGPTWHT